MLLSVIIPACNEEASIKETVQVIYDCLEKENISHQILVVNDHSSDNTCKILQSLQKTIKTLDVENNLENNGFGNTVRVGLECSKGDIIAIMMADLSDDPKDLIMFYRILIKGNYDCVFGDRWRKGGKVYDYPLYKKILNRVFNYCVAFCFGLKYKDITNAFKMYKKETLNGLKPFLSPHFNLTLELPLKAIVRGYTYTVVPNSWRNRKHGIAKLKLREMGSRYFFIFLYCIIEKIFSKDDFKKQ